MLYTLGVVLYQSKSAPKLPHPYGLPAITAAPYTTELKATACCAAMLPPAETPETVCLRGYRATVGSRAAAVAVAVALCILMASSINECEADPVNDFGVATLEFSCTASAAQRAKTTTRQMAERGTIAQRK